MPGARGTYRARSARLCGGAAPPAAAAVRGEPRRDGGLRPDGSFARAAVGLVVRTSCPSAAAASTSPPPAAPAAAPPPPPPLPVRCTVIIKPV